MRGEAIGATLDPAVKKASHRFEEIPLGVSFCAVFSPRGDILATCGKRTITVWDLPAGAKRWETTTLKDPSELAFSPDGARLAAKNTSGRVTVFDVDNGTVMKTVDKGRGEGASPAFSADGRTLVHGSWAGDLFVHDLDKGSESRRVFEGEMVRAVLRAGDRWVVVTSATAGAGRPDRVCVYGASLEGRPEVEFTVADLSHAALSPEGDRLAASRAHHGDIVVVELSSGKLLASTKAKLGGTGAAVRWGPSLLGSVQDGRVELLSPSLERVGGADLVYPSDVSFSPDGALIALGSWSEGTVRSVSDLLG